MVPLAEYYVDYHQQDLNLLLSVLPANIALCNDVIQQTLFHNLILMAALSEHSVQWLELITSIQESDECPVG